MRAAHSLPQPAALHFPTPTVRLVQCINIIATPLAVRMEPTLHITNKTDLGPEQALVRIYNNNHMVIVYLIINS